MGERGNRDHTIEIEMDDISPITLIAQNMNEENSTKQQKQLNLAQEQDDVHLARMIVHFQMLRFAEFSSRFALILLVLLDIIYDSIHIGVDLINDADRALLMLVCAASIVIMDHKSNITADVIERSFDIHPIFE